MSRYPKSKTQQARSLAKSLKTAAGRISDGTASAEFIRLARELAVWSRDMVKRHGEVLDVAKSKATEIDALARKLKSESMVEEAFNPDARRVATSLRAEAIARKAEGDVLNVAADIQLVRSALKELSDALDDLDHREELKGPRLK